MLGAAGLSLVPCHPQVHTHLAAQALQEGIYSLGMSFSPSLTLLPQNSTHSLCPDEMTVKTKEVEEATGLEEDALPCSPTELSEAASAPGMQLSCAGEDLGWEQWGLAPLLCLDGCWRSLRWDTAPGRGGQGAEERACPQVSPSRSCPGWLRPGCAERSELGSASGRGQEQPWAPGDRSSCVRSSSHGRDLPVPGAQSSGSEPCFSHILYSSLVPLPEPAGMEPQPAAGSEQG